MAIDNDNQGNDPEKGKAAAGTELVFRSTAHDEVNLDRLERFQSLEAGTYWRCTKPTKIKGEEYGSGHHAVAPGTVLLLLDVEIYDGKPHTIVLNFHPLEGRGTRKMLVPAFLQSFEPALDADEVRQREMESLQREIAAIQAELIEGQTNPSLLAPVLEAELAAWEKEARAADKKEGVKTPPSTALAHAGHTLRGDLSGAVNNRLTESDVRALRRCAEREAKIAEVKAEWLTARTTAISEKISSLTPFFREKAAVALARTTEVRRYAEELVKGIESLDLYTGKGVVVQTLVEGAAAPAEEPLTLFQRKLYMDEELAAWADVKEKFDFEDVECFDAWLAKMPSLRDQILPTPRCVVSMAIRRRDVQYGTIWEDLSKNPENRRVFLLVRNGENVHRVYSAQDSHERTPRLFPARDDLDRPFTGLDGSRITFQDIQFTDAAREADDISLHYKRFLILLCGLDHRLGLFGRFYDEAQSLSFISMAFQQKFCRFVADDEPHSALGEDRPSVIDWVREKNSYLQSGSRVLCVYSSLLNPKTAPACVKSDGPDRTREYAYPTEATAVKTVYRDAGELCVDVEVTRSRGGGKPFNARVSLTKACGAQYGWDAGFLCLDTVKAADLEWYIHDRASRIRQIEYIRLFKVIAKHLRAEEAAEAPSRAFLKNAIVAAGICTAAAADSMIDTTVQAWRCANRGSPLPSIADKVAFDPILNLLFTLGQNTEHLVTLTLRFIQEESLIPLRLVVTGKNKLALYVEVPPAERDDSVLPWRWVRRLGLNVLKTKVTEVSRRDIWLTGQLNAKETEIKVWPRYTEWINAAPEPFSTADLAAYKQLVDQAIPAANALFTRKGAGVPEPQFTQMLRVLRSRMFHNRYYSAQSLSVPIAVYMEPKKSGGHLAFVCIVEEVQRWLYHFGDDAQKKKLREVFADSFANKESGMSKLAHPFAPVVSASYGVPEMMHGLAFGTDYRRPPKHLREAYEFRRKRPSAHPMFDDLYLPNKRRGYDEGYERWMSIIADPASYPDIAVPACAYLCPESHVDDKSTLEAAAFMSGIQARTPP